MSLKTLSLAQVIGLIAVVVLIVFGVTLATFLLPALGGGGSTIKPAGSQTRQLSIAETDPAVMDQPHERKKPGFKCFWFTNPGDNPVTVSLERKNCRCYSVQVCVLPPDMVGYPTAELNEKADSFTWSVVEDSKAVEVPPKGHGGVRLHWSGKSDTAEVLAALLRTQSKGIEGAPIAIETKVTFIDPVRVSLENDLRALANSEAAGLDLESGRETRRRFIIWSPTRKEFKLQAGEPTLPHPCITWDAPERLSAEKCQQMSKDSGQQVLCAYSLLVTVRERLPDDSKQLDLGPFRRGLTLTTDEDLDPITLRVSGTVHGEVTVGGGDDKEHVGFGHIPAGTTQTKVIYLNSNVPGLNLQLDPDEKRAEFLEATLEPDPNGGTQNKSWKLSVKVNTTRMAGAFPRDESVIVLRTNGNPPRKLRIPVTGVVYVN